MDAGQIIPYAVSALGGGGLLAGILNAFFSRRKLGADAAQIITDAAASVVSTQDGRIRSLEQRDRARSAREDEREKLLRRHEAWDRMLVMRLRELSPPGTKIPDPPPLHVQNKSDDDEWGPEPASKTAVK